MVDISAQTIRKQWSELTSSEKAAFVNAIKSLSASDINNLANEHATLFGNSSTTGIHIASRFLPWHRIFIGFFEELVQAQDPDVTLPYWDWYENDITWTRSNTDLFKDGSVGYLGLFAYPIIGAGSPWNYTRGFSSGSSWYPGEANINETSVTVFSDDIEGEDDNEPHNEGHVFVSGTMGAMISPGDPVFYLHHCMVDKVWADWFRIHPTSTGSGLDTNMETFLGYNGDWTAPRTTVNATDWVNPRDQKLWYAHDNILLLDNYTANSAEVYHYTTGEIIAEDFIIPSSADVEFRTNGQNILLDKGFTVNSGAVFEAITY
jgi:tyrosinase